MLSAATAQAGMQITEFMYQGVDGEFIEFTNTGSSSVNMTGWSFDDNHAVPNTKSLSAFGTVAPGESAILTETAAATFRTDWNLASTVKVIGGNKTNIGRSDQLNLYDASSTLVDRLTYGDQTYPGTIRTNGISGDPTSVSVLGTNNIAGWVLSSVGDTYGSWKSLDGDIGSPGVCNFAPAPEPASIVLALIGLIGLIGFRRRWL
jgi:predicted extracellular nuclease